MNVLFDETFKEWAVSASSQSRITPVYLDALPRNTEPATWCDSKDAVLVTRSEHFLNSHIRGSAPRRIVLVRPNGPFRLISQYLDDIIRLVGTKNVSSLSAIVGGRPMVELTVNRRKIDASAISHSNRLDTLPKTLTFDTGVPIQPESEIRAAGWNIAKRPVGLDSRQFADWCNRSEVVCVTRNEEDFPDVFRVIHCARASEDFAHALAEVLGSPVWARDCRRVVADMSDRNYLVSVDDVPIGSFEIQTTVRGSTSAHELEDYRSSLERLVAARSEIRGDLFEVLHQFLERGISRAGDELERDTSPDTSS